VLGSTDTSGGVVQLSNRVSESNLVPFFVASETSKSLHPDVPELRCIAHTDDENGVASEKKKRVVGATGR